MSALLDTPEDNQGRSVPIYLAIIYGRPGTQGSKKQVFNKKTKRLYFIEDSESGKSWRQELITELLNDRPDSPLDEAVCVKMLVYVPRPKAHYKSNGMLKPTAPKFPTSKPDMDKIMRAVGDALTIARWVKDDSRIAEWRGNPGHGPQRLFLNSQDEIQRTVIAMWSLEEEWRLENKAEEIKESGPKNLLDIMANV